jgi:hypothetical protein
MSGRSVNGQTVRLSSGKAVRPLGARAVGKVENDDRADWSEAWVLFPRTVVYVWHAGIKAGIVQASLEAAALILERRSRLGEKKLCDRPRLLSLQARAVLVRGAQGRDGPVGRRS